MKPERVGDGLCDCAGLHVLVVNQPARRRLVVVEIDLEDHGDDPAPVRLPDLTVARAVKGLHSVPNRIREGDRQGADRVQPLGQRRCQRLRPRAVGMVECLRAAVGAVVGVVVKGKIVVRAERRSLLWAALVVPALGKDGRCIHGHALVCLQLPLHEP